MSNEFVEINITREAQAVSRVGFGVPLIFSDGPVFSGVRTYFSMDDVADDFVAADEEYKLANALFASSIKPEKIKIAKRGVGALEDELNDLVQLDNDWYYLMLSEPTNADILNASAWTEAKIKLFIFETKESLALAAATPVATASRARASNIATIVTGSVHGLAPGDLVTIATLGGTGYNVVGAVVLTTPLTTSFTYANTGANESTAVDAAGTVTKVAASDVMKAKNYDRTFYIYCEDADSRAAAAWVGEEAPKDPGSSTWKFKNLAGVVASNPTPSQLTYGRSKSLNFYTNIGGIDITHEGVVASGEFIDIMLGTDWIQTNMEADIYQALVDEDKIPFTEAGSDVFRQIILNRLNLAVDQGILANDPAPTVFIPAIADVPTQDKKDRILRDITFNGFFAGAVHKVGVNGKISV